MPISKNAFARYLVIDRTIRNTMKKYPNPDALLYKLESEGYNISKAQLDKDIRTLKEDLNAPIVFDKNNKGYIYTSDFSLDGLRIAEEEKWIIDIAEASVKLFGEGIDEEFSKISSKIQTGSRNSDHNEYSGARYIQMELSNSKKGYGFLRPIYQAIIERNAVSLDYAKFGDQPETRIVSPTLLKQYANRWYMLAFHHQKEKTLVFALDRIISINSTTEKYRYDKLFNPEDYFRYSFGITQKFNESPSLVELQFHGQAINYIVSLPLHHSQQIIQENEQQIIITLEVFITQELVMKILSYGSEVKVIAPTQLAEKIKVEILKMQDLYK